MVPMPYPAPDWNASQTIGLAQHQQHPWVAAQSILSSAYGAPVNIHQQPVQALQSIQHSNPSRSIVSQMPIPYGTPPMMQSYQQPPAQPSHQAAQPTHYVRSNHNAPSQALSQPWMKR